MREGGGRWGREDDEEGEEGEVSEEEGKSIEEGRRG